MASSTACESIWISLILPLNVVTTRICAFGYSFATDSIASSSSRGVLIGVDGVT